ncbi:DUF1430 domain-containing protein [Streptococcus ruminantium]|uniref:DUF1430 domain-containing protein n=1 Tax=Streptococcus ruminantium TaxID=1917441 RepID=UPI0012DDC8D5|nr:DUF1430 domain-containing protein [Streptococcus ruminantium]
MKRVFVLFSNLVLSIFFVWVFSIWSDTFVSYHYPSVVVSEANSQVNYSHVKTALTDLAHRTDSLIAIQHQEPGEDGKTRFSYTPFGNGELPEDLKKKEIQDSSTVGVEANYFILKGSVTTQKLRNTLSQIGMANLWIIQPTPLSNLARIFTNGFQLLSIIIFFLTFGSLCLITQIKALRSAGIRLISGENRWKIFLSPLRSDLFNAVGGFALATLAFYILRHIFSLPSLSIYTASTGLLVYNLLLLGIALFFAVLFATGIKKVHLMSVIKGKIPVRGMISLILIGQLLAVIIVSFSMSQTLTYTAAWKQQEQGQVAWQKAKNYITLSASREAIDVGSLDQARPKQIKWLEFMKQAVAEDKAMLVRHHLVDRDRGSGPNSKVLTTSTVWQDYSPQGNVLIVTPQYIRQENIKLSPATSNKVNNLALGEFVLLLPEQLRSEESRYRATFEESMTNLMSTKSLNMTATVDYLPTGQKRFVYNTTPISYQQFLTDPIIIVTTPTSTGPDAIDFWNNALQDYFLFNNLETAQALIKQAGFETWVNELKSGYHIYKTLLDNLKREVWFTIAGGILGIATSILMFNTMNLLYFEEFRRDIFIKRIGGLNFFGLHKNYLLAQLSVLLLGLIVSLLLTTNFAVCLLVATLFVINSILLLYRQMRHENRMSMIILKGA